MPLLAFAMVPNLRPHLMVQGSAFRIPVNSAEGKIVLYDHSESLFS